MPTTAFDSSQIMATFPDIRFTTGNEFRWMPAKNTVEYNPDDDYFIEHLLHEIAHAKLGHASFDRDVQLITLERDAWHYAKIELAPKFNLEINSDLIEDDLNTYRDWLHDRSQCPKCDATGIQTGDDLYTCVICRTEWKVNKAITCGLKRYTQKHP